MKKIIDTSINKKQNIKNEIIDEVMSSSDSNYDSNTDESDDEEDTEYVAIDKSLDKNDILFDNDNSLMSKETINYTINNSLTTNNEIDNKNNKSDIIINGVYDSIEDIADSLKNVQLELKNIYKKFGNLKKDYTKVITIKNKLENKKKKQKQKLQCGFVKPRPISVEMCLFLKIEEGSLLGRNEVTKKVNEYIVLNNLRSESDRRIILPNPELKKIFGIEADDTTVISYFNMQMFLKRHYI